MKIGIHREPCRGSLGGAEYSMVVLAEALSRHHAVELVHHFPNLGKDRLHFLFGAELKQVSLRYVPSEPPVRAGSAFPWRRLKAARSHYAGLSAPYDLFVSFTHGEEPPPFSHARVGVLLVLFPLSVRPALWAPRGTTGGWMASLKERLGRSYLDWEWRQRLASYRIRICISEFTRDWTRRLWGSEWRLLYPPVEMDFHPAERVDAIVSVGRFTSLKKQMAMAAAFCQMRDLHLQGWKLHCAGGLGDGAEEQETFNQVRRLGKECPVQALANVERPRLKALYEEAKIFWHAAGYGVDDVAEPGLTEHFGIATVEAMAAGCVPVVIRRGGQPEIVRHGVDGFLWDAVEELQQYTRVLAADEALRSRMAAAARARAQEFSKEKFVQRFRELVGPVAPEL